MKILRNVNLHSIGDANKSLHKTLKCNLCEGVVIRNTMILLIHVGNIYIVLSKRKYITVTHFYFSNQTI